MSSSLRPRASSAFVAFGLIATSQPVFLPGGNLTVVVLSVVAIVCLWLVFVHEHRLVIPIPLVLFALWAFLSLGWSESLTSSLNASLNLVLATLIGAKCATGGPAPIMRGLQNGALIVLLASVAYAAVRPAEGLVTEFYNQGALQGIYSHRNTLAAILAIGFAAAACRFGAKDGPRWKAVAMLLVLGGGILATQSSTGMAVAVLSLVILAAVAVGRAVGSVGRVMIAMVMILVLTYAPVWFSTLISEVTGALGRDVTLTGRTYIWESAWPWVQDSPILGHGWGDVWLEGDVVGDAIRRYYGYGSATSAHNGYLDVLLHVGVIGLALYAAVLLPAIIRAMRLALNDPRHVWMIVVLGTFLVNNMLESRAIRPNGEFIVALVASAALHAVLEARRNGLHLPASAIADVSRQKPRRAVRTAPSYRY